MYNAVDIHFLIAAVVVISMALVFYTVGVWGERIQKGLRIWHLCFFSLGFLCDTVGTSLMEHIAELTHKHNDLHTITGTIAITLMLVHTLWAFLTYFRGSLKAKQHFSRFSIVVWTIWLIPYFIGMYIGMSAHMQ